MSTQQETLQMPGKGDKIKLLGWKLMSLAFFLYVLDQVTKMLVVWNFYPPVSSGVFVMTPEPKNVVIPVIENFFNIVHVHNTGAAFGLGNGSSWSTYVFLAVPIIACIVLVVLLCKGVFSSGLMKIGWVLLFVGVCGNLTDRLVQGFMMSSQYNLGWDFWTSLKKGAVIDFVDIIVPFTNGWHWPAFNVADSCICIAAVIFVYWSFKEEAARKRVEASS